jgi:tyrosine-protein phosphatase SIW14
METNFKRYLMKSINYLKNLKLFVTCFKTIGFGIKVTFIHTVGFIIGTMEIFSIMIRQRFLGHKLPNYGVVEPLQLHRGGQPDAHGLNELENKGIKTVIHLRDRKLKNYKGKLKRFFIPFNPYQPRDKVVIEFLKVIGNQAHHPVFVHCFHGADRTGMLCAIYRIVIQKWDKEKAIEEMKKYGFHFWHKSLIDYIRKMDIESIKQQAGLIEVQDVDLSALSSLQSADETQKE